MIIVEFCRFGNVQDFLVKNRSFFVNQIQPHDDKIDSTILSRYSFSYSLLTFRELRTPLFHTFSDTIFKKNFSLHLPIKAKSQIRSIG